ncbi:methyltransferase family protein [Seohaeicola zhoushanensis]|uniref:S-isoprenylcysteine methyltransferase n=1 Tax=Seohaeicola zhoushanensis TaxID=1569283 RepID=A0A8J3GU90_9RHOB|nr:methyltransferase [Seohaeicola zhoushanensis]GHF35848.1 S-isoprenylcysteine methyltransferase [Seohaeicola zhoushanensis]
MSEQRLPFWKWIDIPPVWLLGFALLAWAQGRWWPLGLSLANPVTDLLAGVLIGGGILLMLLAFSEFRKQRTTVVPHRTPSRLIQSGIFSRTRNPIYLGDALVLAGLVLRLDAVASLVLVVLFVWVIERRFIIPEENRLRRTFHADFARYERKVRRWV